MSAALQCSQGALPDVAAVRKVLMAQDAIL